MNRDRKLTVLESLLERVRGRASAPRVAAPSPAAAPAHVAGPSSAAIAPASTIAESLLSVSEPPSVAEAEQRPVAAMAAAHPAIEAAPPPREGDGALGHPVSERPVSERRVSERPVSEHPVSEPPSSELDDDEGPPSAPRLREGLAMGDEEEEEEDTDQDFQDDEGPIKTPPPESGRQHVASPAPPVESSDDIDISITVTDAELTPSPPSPMVSEPAPVSQSSPMVAQSPPSEPERSPPPESQRTGPPTTELGLDMGPPRLAFVSEPEIDIHVRPRPPIEPAPMAAPVATTAPTPSSIAPTPSSIAPPVRMMAQPAANVPGPPSPPVEVWASTHAPAGLRGQVAAFVGQNASFAPKSFGELLEASLQLGES